MDYITAPLTRVEALIEGTYPVVAVSGRSITAARFVATRLHGDLEDEDFPMKHFAPSDGAVPYLALPVAAGYADPDRAINARSGMQRKRIDVRVVTGYVIGQSSPRIGAGAQTTKSAALIAGLNDHETIAQAMIWPGFWQSGSTIYGIRAAGDTTHRVLVEHQRLLVETTFEVSVSYAPGTP